MKNQPIRLPPRGRRRYAVWSTLTKSAKFPEPQISILMIFRGEEAGRCFSSNKYYYLFIILSKWTVTQKSSQVVPRGRRVSLRIESVILRAVFGKKYSFWRFSEIGYPSLRGTQGWRNFLTRFFVFFGYEIP